MKKPLLTTLLCLLLGVVTTVGVAWGLAWVAAPLFLCSVAVETETNGWADGFVVVDSGYMRAVLQERAVWPEASDAALRARVERLSWIGVYSDVPNRIPGVRSSIPDSLASELNKLATEELLIVDTSGWPKRAMSCWYMHDQSFRLRRIVGGIRTNELVGPIHDVAALPLRPILPGFIINTLFYAAIWFGVFFGVAAVRRGVRRKRGRCVRCSYDLRVEFENGCPECGWNRSEPRP